MTQLLIQASAQMPGRAADSPTADRVATPEMIADMIIDRQNPNTSGAKRCGIT